MNFDRPKTKILCMDVDGTLTNGKIYISSSGECMKAFDVKDGYGIARLLPEKGIVPVIITGRKSAIVEKRAAELGIREIYQGVEDKCAVLEELIRKYACQYAEAAYIGDDIPDLACMKMCGIKGCPQDAVSEVKEICDYICERKAGAGAVREFIDWLVNDNEQSGKTGNFMFL